VFRPKRERKKGRGLPNRCHSDIWKKKGILTRFPLADGRNLMEIFTAQLKYPTVPPEGIALETKEKCDGPRN